MTPSTGAPGATVTLNGANLVNVQAVYFNGVPVDIGEFEEISATVLTATVPIGATSGPITIITPGGSAASAAFTVTAALTPTITGFAPGSGAVGGSVVLTGTNLTGATDVLFAGARVDPLEFTVDLDTQITVQTIPSGAKTGSISVVTPGGVATSAGSFTVVTPTAPAPKTGWPSCGDTFSGRPRPTCTTRPG